MPNIQNIKHNLSYDALLDIYQRMMLIRKSEEAIFQLYRDRYIGGYCHVYIGQEAVLMGVKHNFKQQDSMITGYRSHAHLLESGASLEQLLCELLGRKDGVSRGKGGSMHLFWPKENFYGGHGSVGSYISIGTGLALAHKRIGKGKAYVFFGDGAANQGQMYESINMAALWKLPVVYILENNGYAIGSTQARTSAGGDLRHRVEAFGVKTVEADGMNPFDMISKVSWADSIVQSGGQVLIEAKTYRFKGHSISDPATYRDKKEVDDAKARDPLTIVQNALKALSKDAINDIDNISKIIKNRVRQAVEFAQNNHEPCARTLYEDVYTNHESKHSLYKNLTLTQST